MGGVFPDLTGYTDMKKFVEVRQKLFRFAPDGNLMIPQLYSHIGPHYQMALPLLNVYPVNAFAFFIYYFRICLTIKNLEHLTFTVIYDSIVLESNMKVSDHF